jgi:hypothetical protein
MRLKTILIKLMKLVELNVNEKAFRGYCYRLVPNKNEDFIEIYGDN